MSNTTTSDKGQWAGQVQTTAAALIDKLNDKDFQTKVRANPRDYTEAFGYSTVDADTKIEVVTNTQKTTYFIIVNNSSIDLELLPQITAAGASTASTVGSLGSASSILCVLSCGSSFTTASTAGSVGSADPSPE